MANYMGVRFVIFEPKAKLSGNAREWCFTPLTQQNIWERTYFGRESSSKGKLLRELFFGRAPCSEKNLLRKSIFFGR